MHPSWRIVGASALIQFLFAGLLTQAFGLYVAYLSEDNGWSKTALAGGAALQSLEGALLGPLLGWAVDRFGARLMVVCGVIASGLGFAALSQIDTLTGFYGAILLLALGGSLSGYFPLTIIVLRWFRQNRARALSLMTLGLPLGGVVVPLVAWLMQTHGWRTTALCSGILYVVVGLPLAVLLREPPAPAVQTPAQQQAAAAESTSERSFTAREALRLPAFWLLGWGHAFALLVVTAVNVHAISHMKIMGYSVAQASWVIMLMTVAQTGGVMLAALVGDRWDRRLIAVACMLGHTTALLLLTFATHTAMLIAFAVIHGVAWGMRGPLMQAIRADYFGLKALGMIMGMSAWIIAFGQVGGPLVAGAFADATGNYTFGFALLACIAGLGSILFAFARKPA